MNAAMARLLDRIDISGITESEIPGLFREVLDGGWTIDPTGAMLLRRLKESYNGEPAFVDPVHKETTINGRGMIDYDLPIIAAEREEKLLRRCIAYACAAIRVARDVRQSPETLSYITMSVSSGGEKLLTANVTFCGDYNDFPSYIANIDDYRNEALMEISLADLDHCWS